MAEKEIYKNIVMIAEGDIVTSHILERLLIQCSRQHLDYTKFVVSDLALEKLSGYSLPLFIRSADPLNLYFVECLSRTGKSYIYYLDDNFWALTGNTPLEQYYSQPLVRNALERIISGAKCVIVNSDILAVVVRKFNKNVVVLNSFFDFTLINGLIQDRHNEIRIGFAGSTTRGGDFEVIIPAIRRIIEKYSNKVVFEFAGILPDGLVEGENIRFFPTNDDYAEYVKWQYLRAWDIALAPLVPMVANLAKTNNKYREYGACFVAGIYSDYGPYPESVENGITGLLVEWSEDEWYRSMCLLIENEELRKKIGFLAYEDIKTNYSLSSVADQWIEVFNSIKIVNVNFSRFAKKFIYFKVKYKIISICQWVIFYYKLNGLTKILIRLFHKSMTKGLNGYRNLK